MLFALFSFVACSVCGTLIRSMTMASDAATIIAIHWKNLMSSKAKWNSIGIFLCRYPGNGKNLNYK